MKINMKHLPSKLNCLNHKGQAIIICCALAMRSSGAHKVLFAKGDANLVNDDGRSNLEGKLN